MYLLAKAVVQTANLQGDSNVPTQRIQLLLKIRAKIQDCDTHNNAYHSNPHHFRLEGLT